MNLGVSTRYLIDRFAPSRRWRAPLTVVGVTVLSIVLSHAQGTLQITFDEPPERPGTQHGVTEYFESGMWFKPVGPYDPGNQFARNGGGIPYYPDNGTTYLQAALGESLMLSFTDSSAFDLVSVDLAEYSTAVADAVTVPFVGYRPDGSTVTAYFTTDGIIDGTGPLADFQTFHFGQEFSGLIRVEIPTYGWSLDNLVVAVPEPGSGILFIVAVFTFWWVKGKSGAERSHSQPRPKRQTVDTLLTRTLG